MSAAQQTAGGGKSADGAAEIRRNFRARFGREPDVVAEAPGRIEVIGNHTDYNGGPVLGAAIDRGVRVAVAARVDGRRRLASGRMAAPVETTAADPEKRRGAESWANYPLGVLAALREAGRRVPAGFDYLAESDLPAGAGLSSSAAIELASALAFGGLTGEELPRAELVRVARWAENHFVGVPCGILDQAVSAFGRKDHLVYVDCREPRFETLPLPAGTHFRVFDTRTKHALVDGLYAERHRECLEAARGLGVALLADLTQERLEAGRAALAPGPARRAQHVVGEIARVGAARAALAAGDLAEVGRLLTASHRSSQHAFENSTAELDFLVAALTAVRGVRGARLTGGGFGGAVLAWTTADFGAVEEAAVADAYAARFGVRPEAINLETGEGARLR